MSKFLYKQSPHQNDFSEIDFSGKTIKELLDEIGHEYRVYRDSTPVPTDHIIQKDSIYHIVPKITGDDTSKALGLIAAGILIAFSGGTAAAFLGASSTGAVATMITTFGTGLVTSGIQLYNIAQTGKFDDSTVDPLATGQNQLLRYTSIPHPVGQIKWPPPYLSKPIYEGTNSDLLYTTGLNTAIVDPSSIGEHVGQPIIKNYLQPNVRILDDEKVRNETQGYGQFEYNNQEFLYTTDPETTEISFHLTVDAYNTNKAGKWTRTTVFAYYREVGSSTWLPFYAEPQPSFGHYTDTQEAYDSWDNTGPILYDPPKILTITSGKKRIYRKLHIRRGLPPAQYEVRVQVGPNDATQHGKWYHYTAVDYFQSRSKMAYQQSSHDLLSILRVKHDKSDLVRVLTQTHVNGQYTQNPADYLLEFFRGLYAPDGTLYYGLGLDDADIDLASISAWKSWCDANNIRINWLIPANASKQQIMDTFAQVGKAKVTYGTGKLGVVWASGSDPIVQNFNITNILEDTPSVQFIDPTFDIIEASFYDESNDYRMTTVRRVINPAGRSTKQLQLKGVTNQQQAEDTVNTFVEAYKARKRIISWEVDNDIAFARMGQRVSFADNVVGVPSARIKSSTGNVLTLFYPIEHRGETSATIIRSSDNYSETVTLTPAFEDTDTITVTGLSFQPEEHDVIILGEPLQLRVTEVTPGKDKTKYIAVDDPDSIYNPTNDTTTVPIDHGQDRVVKSLIVQEYRTTGTTMDIELTWYSTNTAQHTVRYQLDESPWETITVLGERHIIRGVDITTQKIKVYVDPKPEGTGTYTEKTFDIGTYPMLPVRGLTLTGDGSNTFTGRSFEVTWHPQVEHTNDIGDTIDQTPRDADLKHFKLEIWSDSKLLRTVTTTSPKYLYDYSEMQADSKQDIPPREYTIKVWQVGIVRPISPVRAITVSNPQLPTTAITSVDSRGRTVTIKHNGTGPDVAGALLFASTVSGFTPSGTTPGEGNCIADFQGNQTTVMVDQSTDYYFILALYDTFGKDNLNYSPAVQHTIQRLSGLDIDAYNTIDTALNNDGFQILGDHIAANTIVGRNLYLTDFSNLIVQSEELSSWYNQDEYPHDIITSNTRTRSYQLGRIEINNDEDYRISVEIATLSTQGIQTGLIFRCLDENYQYLAWRAYSEVITPSPDMTNLNWQRVSTKDIFVNINNIKYVDVFLFIDHPVGATGDEFYFRNIRLHRMSNAELIVDGTLTASEINSQDLAVNGLANINDAYINSAHIEDLSVSTLKIQDNAVTVGSYKAAPASPSGVVNIQDNNVWHDVIISDAHDTGGQGGNTAVSFRGQFFYSITSFDGMNSSGASQSTLNWNVRMWLQLQRRAQGSSTWTTISNQYTPYEWQRPIGVYRYGQVQQQTFRYEMTSTDASIEFEDTVTNNVWEYRIRARIETINIGINAFIANHSILIQTSKK